MQFVAYRACRDNMENVRKLISISQLDGMLVQVPTVNEEVDLILWMKLKTTSQRKVINEN